jgi:hypothetical protein
MISNARRNGLAPPVAVLLAFAALALAGCATSNFDAIPEKLGGLPEGAPARPAEAPAYPNVYQPMTPREIKKLTEGEQKSAEQELMALREHQNQRANPPPAPTRSKVTATTEAKKKQAAKKGTDTRAAEKKAPDKQTN